MNDNRFKKRIITPIGVFDFVIIAHRTDSKEGRLIEPAFYEKNCEPGQMPEGVHHELEVVEPRLWEHQDVRTHLHPVPGSDKHFVCWTGSLPTLEVVDTLLNVWCLGTAYTVATGQDFGSLYTGSPAVFFDVMRSVGFTLEKPPDKAES